LPAALLLFAKEPPRNHANETSRHFSLPHTRKLSQMIMPKALIAAFALLATCSLATGFPARTQAPSSVEIDSGQLVRSGETIEVYDSREGSKTYDVDSTPQRRYR
jgi:hypothetical protein